LEPEAGSSFESLHPLKTPKVSRLATATNERIIDSSNANCELMIRSYHEVRDAAQHPSQRGQLLETECYPLPFCGKILPIAAMPTTSTTDSPLAQAIAKACTGDRALLRLYIARRCGLPGERPNLKLAEQIARELLSRGKPGEDALKQLRTLNQSEAPGGSVDEFLPIVGVLALGIQATSAKSASEASGYLDQLQPFAEDTRNHLRESVATAVVQVLLAQGDELVESLAAWTDGYLQAHVAVSAVADPGFLRSSKEPNAILTRLHEAFCLLKGAPRAHERSQGYRTLVRTLSKVPAQIGKRFPAETLHWLVEHCDTVVPELREALTENVAALRKAGLRKGDVEEVQKALDETAPPRRDPRTYVGPTRSRGAKAEREGKKR
jgi:hypothetical protein